MSDTFKHLNLSNIITVYPMDRILLFLVGCIGVRTLITYLAYIATTPYLRYMGYIAILPVLGNLYLFVKNTRKTTTLGHPLWWNPIRPIHALLYGLFAYNAIQGNHRAWIYLLLDVMIGLLAFVHNEYKKFRKQRNLIHSN